MLIFQPQNLGLTNYRIRVGSHCNGSGSMGPLLATKM